MDLLSNKNCDFVSFWTDTILAQNPFWRQTYYEMILELLYFAFCIPLALTALPWLFSEGKENGAERIVKLHELYDFTYFQMFHPVKWALCSGCHPKLGKQGLYFDLDHLPPGPGRSGWFSLIIFFYYVLKCGFYHILSGFGTRQQQLPLDFKSSGAVFALRSQIFKVVLPIFFL